MQRMRRVDPGRMPINHHRLGRAGTAASKCG
jgi:hypothetical protein